MTRSFVTALRILLVLLLAGAVALQIFSGALGATLFEGVSAAVLAALVVAGLLCVEAVIACVWMLLTAVRTGSIFDAQSRSDRWVNTVITALLVAAGFAAFGLAWFGTVQATQPGPAGLVTVVLSAAALGASVALALIVVVMRHLLHTAAGYQSELAEVV